MSSTTTRLGLYKPAADGSENVNVVTDLNNNLDKLDSFIGAVPCTSGTRPATRYQGMFIYETDTGKVYVCANPTTPTWLQVHVAGVTIVDDMALTGSLATTGGIVSARTSATDAALSAKTAAASVAQLAVLANGSCQWGPGTGAADTVLARTNTGELTLTGDLIVSDDVTITDALSAGGNTSIGGTLAVTGAVTVGSTVSISGASWANATLANGWTGSLKYLKAASPPNSLWLRASLTPGTKTDGTTLTTLPVGFRPTVAVDVEIPVSSLSTQSPHLNIATTGVVAIWGCANAAGLNFYMPIPLDV